jgi:release factor glutamine methyltransferase
VSLPAPPRAGAMTRGALVAELAEILGSGAEAKWVVEHVMATPGSTSFSHSEIRPATTVEREITLVPRGAFVSGLDREVEPEGVELARSLVARRVAGEPLQYLLGTWAFRTLELAIDPRVLIPRPETEVVVEVALEELRRLAPRADSPMVVVDLGTGSGAIALSLAVEGGPLMADGSGLEVWATDLSADALDVARANVAAVAGVQPALVAGVNLARGSWFEALPASLEGRLSLVVANPPYVSEAEWQELDAVVADYEPKGALVAGPVGTESLRKIIEGARRWLSPSGSVVLELAPWQGDPMTALAQAAGFVDVEVYPDLAGRPRVLVARVDSGS